MEQLVRTAEFNHSIGSNSALPQDKPCLLYSPETFSSGKTTFGYRGLSLLHDPITTSLLLHPPAPTKDTPADLIAMRNKQTFTQDLLDSYINARTLFVDLRGGLSRSCSMAPKHISFKEALYHAIYCAATGGRIHFHDFLDEIGTIAPENLMTLIAKKTGYTGRWFMFIDNVEYTEREIYAYDDLKDPASYLTQPTSGLVDCYSLLFDILHPFLLREEIFIYCAGQSPYLAERTLYGSLVRLQKLALPTLQREHIIKTLCITIHEGISLQQALRIDDTVLPLFAATLHQHTRGIPLYITRVLESLLGYHKPTIPHTKAEIEKVYS